MMKSEFEPFVGLNCEIAKADGYVIRGTITKVTENVAMIENNNGIRIGLVAPRVIESIITL